MDEQKIESLTEEQWQQVYGEREKWKNRGVSTERADRPAVERAMDRIYQEKGLETPKYVWAHSVWGSIMLAALCGQKPDGLHVDDSVDFVTNVKQWRAKNQQKLTSALRTLDLEEYLWVELAHTYLGNDGQRLPHGEEIHAHVTGLANAAFPASNLLGWNRNKEKASTINNFLDRLQQNAREAYNNTQCSGWDMAWLAFYSVCRDLNFTTYPEPLSQLLDDFVELTFGTTSWTPYAQMCFLSDRPTSLVYTGEYRDVNFHNADGPSISFADGWNIYVWNNTRVPEWVVMDPTVEKIHAESNIEIRRCAIERKGWDNYILEAGFKLSDPVQDPGNPGQTLCLSQPLDLFGDDEDERVRVLLCVNGTVERNGERRRFGLTVPSGITDPVEAAAWSYGVPVETYKQLQRRT